MPLSFIHFLTLQTHLLETGLVGVRWESLLLIFIVHGWFRVMETTSPISKKIF